MLQDIHENRWAYGEDLVKSGGVFGIWPELNVAICVNAWCHKISVQELGAKEGLLWVKL